MKRVIGPFKQILTLRGLPIRGALMDQDLDIVDDGAIVVEGSSIYDVISWKDRDSTMEIEEVDRTLVALPGFIDSHTHLCWGGNRAHDYALRVSGATYQEILKKGGGIYDTVKKTTAATREELLASLKKRMDRLVTEGVTTVEIKSGYGLGIEEELKILEVIIEVGGAHHCDVVSTCLAAHVCPPEFKDPTKYLKLLTKELFPRLKDNSLADRIDIFVEEGAFNSEISRSYLSEARTWGFDLTVHADQFSVGGSQLAVDLRALSADHLEASGENEIKSLGASDTVATVLPGASLGLGMSFAPARKLLDAGAILSIASDWNPGSAPMGDLLLQAAVLGAAEKLTTAETFAGITFRAARALGMTDRGVLQTGMKADLIGFDVDDFREILWNQGKVKPAKIWKNGIALR